MARSPSQFSLSAIPSRVGIGLSALILAQCNSLWVGIALSAPLVLSETSKVVIFEIPTVRLENCLRKLQPKFEDNPTVNESGS